MGTHTRNSKPPRQPEQNSSQQKSSKLHFIKSDKCLVHLSYLQSSRPVITIFLFQFSSMLKSCTNTSSFSNQLYYSCDIWPISIETGFTTYQTNTCADNKNNNPQCKHYKTASKTTDLHKCYREDA